MNKSDHCYRLFSEIIALGSTPSVENDYLLFRPPIKSPALLIAVSNEGGRLKRYWEENAKEFSALIPDPLHDSKEGALLRNLVDALKDASKALSKPGHMPTYTVDQASREAAAIINAALQQGGVL